MAYPSQQWRCRTCRTTCNSIDAIALRCFACQAATVVSATWATKCSHRKLKANFQVPNQWWVMSCLMPGHKLPSHESYTWLQTLYLDIWDPAEGNQAPCRLISVKHLWHLSYTSMSSIKCRPCTPHLKSMMVSRLLPLCLSTLKSNDQNLLFQVGFI